MRILEGNNEVNLKEEVTVKMTLDTRKQKKELIELFGCCEICGYAYTPSLQVHHIVKYSDGGSNDVENLALLCPNCHSLVHSLASESSLDLMGFDEINKWLQKNFNKIQRNKIFFYSSRLFRGERNV